MRRRTQSLYVIVLNQISLFAPYYLFTEKENYAIIILRVVSHVNACARSIQFLIVLAAKR